MHMCEVHEHDMVAHGGLKRTPELELQIVVSCSLLVLGQNSGPCKSSKCFNSQAIWLAFFSTRSFLL